MARQRKSKSDFELAAAKLGLMAWFAFEGAALGAILSAALVVLLLGWDALNQQLAAAGVGLLLGGMLGGILGWRQANREVWRD